MPVFFFFVVVFTARSSVIVIDIRRPGAFLLDCDHPLKHPLPGLLRASAEVQKRSLRLRGDVPEDPAQRRDEVAVLGVVGGDGPAEEEGAADEEPEDFHAEGHVGEEGDEEAGREEEKRLGGFVGEGPGGEAGGGGGCGLASLAEGGEGRGRKEEVEVGRVG